MKRKALAIMFSISLFVFGTQFSIAAGGSELRNLVIQKEPGRLAVTLQTAEAVVYESFTLMGPNRLIFDLQNTTYFAVEPLIAVKHMGVVSIRTAQNRPDVVRVVFDFADGIPPYVIGDSPEGIVVTFREPDPEPEPETVRGVVPVAAKPVETEAPKPAPVKPKAAPVRKDKPAPAFTDAPGRMLAAGLQAGLYLMQDSDFQELYGKSAMFFGAGGSYFLFLNGQEAVGVDLDFKVIGAEGKTSFLEEDIKLRLIPFSLSAAYLRKYANIMPYVALGADFLSYRETYPTDFAVPETSGTTLGVNIALGTYVAVSDNILLRAFVKFHSLRAKIEEDLTVNFGGNEIGLGISYRFNY
ncbi:MAG: AMIN domain-containing protein [Acidobacteriota bacterium]|nr:AMIN domain-containing protein [Acidobacteriota bacterium]